MKKKWTLPFMLVLCLLIWLSPSVYAGCDASLTPSDNLGYVQRGNRCEGFYIAKVSSNISLVGLIRGKFHYELSKDEIISVSNTSMLAMTPQVLHIRAQALPLKSYYRMDSILPSGNNEVFHWPVASVLLKRNMDASQVAAFGWYLNANKSVVYFPLSFSSQLSSVKNDKIVRMILRSESKIKSLKINWIELPEQTVQSTTLFRTYYSGDSIIVKPPEHISGLVYVEIEASNLDLRYDASDIDKRQESKSRLNVQLDLGSS
ncbi:MAG: hypothetical protein OEY38_20995 [Gammaproteobacteria bacterium]|nr:hypothetical protein [Gammaproteobacteria bacterium]